VSRHSILCNVDVTAGTQQALILALTAAVSIKILEGIGHHFQCHLPKSLGPVEHLNLSIMEDVTKVTAYLIFNETIYSDDLSILLKVEVTMLKVDNIGSWDPRHWPQ